MTDSTFKKPKHRRNSFDSDLNAREDFLLADLQVIPDDTELTIVPLEHLLDEEDAIDRLLVNTGFDTAEAMRVEEKFDTFAADTLSLINEVAGFEELTGVPDNDQAFVVEPIVEPARQTGIAAIPDTNFQIDEFISDYFDKRAHIEVIEPQIAPDTDVAAQALEAKDSSEPGLKIEPLAESGVPEPETALDAEIAIQTVETVNLIESGLEVEPIVEEPVFFEPQITLDTDIAIPALETEDLIGPGLKIEPLVEDLGLFEPQITLDADIAIEALEAEDLIEPGLKVEPLAEESGISEPQPVLDTDIAMQSLETVNLIEPGLKVEPPVEQSGIPEPQPALNTDVAIQTLETRNLIEPSLKVESIAEEPDGQEPSLINSTAPARELPQQPEATTKPDAGFQIDDFINDYFDKRPTVAIHQPETSPQSKTDDLAHLAKRTRTDTAPTAKSNPVARSADNTDTMSETISDRFSGGAAVLHAGKNLFNKLKAPQGESVIGPAKNKAAFAAPHLDTEEKKTNTIAYAKDLKTRLNKTEKTTLVTYAALVFGIAALVSISVLGIMVYDMKNEVSKLSVLLEIIKDDVEAHAVKTSGTK